MNNKLSPNVKLGCSKCSKSLNTDDLKFNFKLSEQQNKVKTIVVNQKVKKSSKVISLF